MAVRFHVEHADVERWGAHGAGNESSRRKAAHVSRVKPNTMKVIAALAITAIVVVLLLWGFTSSNTSPQTKALSGKEIKSAPVHQVNHLNKLTVGVTGCFNLGDDDERGRVEVCKADAHSMINGQRIDLSLTCFLSWATCVRLTSNEDYYFEVVSGLPECQNFEKIHMTCIKIHARPYDAIYINTKREKR